MANEATENNAFLVYDCSLVTRATGESVSNLRELLHAVRDMDTFVLEHHMMRCQLGDWFMLEEFPNDLARWCWRELDDHSTGERLALVNPYGHEDIESVRKALIDVLEESLWSAPQPLVDCRAGGELHLVGSQLVAYATGMRAATTAALAEDVPRMSMRSLYYHVHDARRRTAGRTDDFSAWLEAIGADAALVQAIRQIDFYFMNLAQLRTALMRVFQENLPAFQVPTESPSGFAAPVEVAT